MHLVQPRMTVENSFFNYVDDAPKYNIGCEIAVAKEEFTQPTIYKYIKASADLTANVPYVLVQKAEEIGTSTPATSTVAKHVGIPQVAIGSGKYGFVAVAGPCLAVGGAMAKGDTLEVLNNGVKLIVDGTTGSPAETANTVAIAQEGGTDGSKTKVVLLGKAVAVAAS